MPGRCLVSWETGAPPRAPLATVRMVWRPTRLPGKSQVPGTRLTRRVRRCRRRPAKGDGLLLRSWHLPSCLGGAGERNLSPSALIHARPWQWAEVATDERTHRSACVDDLMHDARSSQALA